MIRLLLCRSPIFRRRTLISLSNPNPSLHSLSSSTSSTPSTPPPPSDPPSPLISTVVSLLTHHRSKSRWTYLCSLLSSDAPLSPSHFSQITLHFKSNPHLALNFFHFSLRNPSLFTHNLHSYATIIHILTRSRQKARAFSVIKSAFVSPALFLSGDTKSAPLKFFETLVRTYRECDSAPFVFDLLIKSCLELKKIDGSLLIVRMLRSRGISPQISTCNDLISSVSRIKGAYAGFGVFGEVFGAGDSEKEGEVKRVSRIRPNVHSFNELMMGFYRDGEITMVEEVWSEMKRFGCVANVYSYSVLMTVLCELGRVEEAEKLWEEMKVEGIQLDALAYNTMISGLCDVGEMDKAEVFLRNMGLDGMESSCVTFEKVIKGYCRVGEVDTAVLVYKDMRRKGFTPEASTMDVLIEGLCGRERVLEALESMRVATRDVGFHPSATSYELLIMGLCKDGKVEEALKLQAEMVGKGFEPNSKIYGAFIEGCMKLGNEEMASMLRKEMDSFQNR